MKIKQAAIRTQEGQIFEGRSHGDCYKALKEAGIDPQTSRKCDQGFVTEDGEFVDRKKAAEIAFKAGQTPKLVTVLFSEDLTGDWRPWEKK